MFKFYTFLLRRTSEDDAKAKHSFLFILEPENIVNNGNYNPQAGACS